MCFCVLARKQPSSQQTKGEGTCWLCRFGREFPAPSVRPLNPYRWMLKSLSAAESCWVALLGVETRNQKALLSDRAGWVGNVPKVSPRSQANGEFLLLFPRGRGLVAQWICTRKVGCALRMLRTGLQWMEWAGCSLQHCCLQFSWTEARPHNPSQLQCRNSFKAELHIEKAWVNN